MPTATSGFVGAGAGSPAASSPCREDPQSTEAWQRGSVGETKLAKTLAKVDREDTIVLHYRKVPRTKGNIDHLVVCPAGVFVVDSKRYEGQVHTKDKDIGGLLTGSDLRLFVGRRDCTRLAIAMEWQVAAVKGASTGIGHPYGPFSASSTRSGRCSVAPGSSRGAHREWPIASPPHY